MANTPDNFSEKVLAKLKEKNMAVDLTDEPIDNQPVEAQSEPIQAFSDQGFTAFGAAGTAPTSGGNKDILIIPGYGGTTATSASQINFYWIEPSTLPTDNNDASGTTRRSTLYNYSDDLNNPVLVFGGYNGTTSYAPAATFGGVTTNTVAKIWIHPFTGTIDTDYMNFGTNSVTASTSAGILSWVPGSTRLSVGDGTSAKQIAYTSDVTSANQITASANNTDTTLYPLFISDPGDGTTNRIVYTGDATNSPVLNGANGNLTITGDLAVNGLDITTGTGTASLFNANATAVNIGGAATAVSIGASTGTFTIGNTTAAFTNATSFTGTASAITFFGASTSVTAFGAAATLSLGSSTGTITIANPTVTTGTSSLTLFNTGATTVAAFGAATTLGLGSSTGTATISNTTVSFPNATSITSGSGLATVFAAANPSSLAVFGSATTATIFGASTTLSLGSSTGTITIANPTVTTGTSSLTLFNTGATTVAAFGAATTLGLGSSTGTATISNTTVSFPNATSITSGSGLATVFAAANPASLAVFGSATTATIFGASTTLSLGSSTGTITIANPTVTTGTSSLTLFNTNATTVAAFGAATTLGLGSSAGTATISNATIAFPNATSITSGSGLATVFAAANPASLAVFGSATTATIFGASTTLSLGSSTGTITIANPTVTTGTSSLTLFNTNATTVAAFGAATALTMGSSSGTATTNNATIAFPNATSITSGATLATVFAAANPSSLALFGAATTVVGFASATSLSLGGTTATSTTNIATGVVAGGNTKTINIGTGGAATSITAITIGNSLNTSGSTISFAGNRLQSVGEPTAASDAATKNYVDSFQQGLDLHEAVRAVSATAIGTSVLYFQQNAASSTLGTVIGTSYIESANNETLSTTYFDNLSTALATGQRLLVASGASTTTYNINGVTTAPTGGTNVMNGIYTVTSVGGAGSKWRLDRATDTNDNIELQGGTFTFVQEGAIYDNSGWTCTNNTATTPISIGADAIVFTQFSGAGLLTAGAGLTKTGNTIDVGAGTGITVNPDSVQISASYVGQSSITTLGTVTTGIWNANTIPLGYGGTGTTTYGSNNGLIYYDNASTRLSTLTTGANTTVLVGAGAGSLPQYAQVNLGTMVTGTLPLANGGLGTTTFTQNGVLYGNLATSVLVTAASGAAGAILQTTTSGAAPSFSTTLPGTYSFSTTTAATGTTTAGVVFSGGIGVGSTSYFSDLYVTGTIFSATSATTVSLNTSPTGATTTNIGTGAVTSATKTINIGTGAASGGTTAITIGTTTGTSTTTINGNLVLSSALPIAQGGTGTATAPTQWGVIFATSTTQYSSTGQGSSNQWLRGAGAGAPTWSTATLATTYSQYDLVYAGTANAVSGLANTSTSVLVSQTTGPTWLQGVTGNRLLKTSGTAISWSQVDLTADVTGTLPVGNGGTGTSAITVGGVVYMGSTAATGLQSVSPAAANKHLVSTGTGTTNYPVWSTATMATTYTAGNILYASATDTVGGLATSGTSALVSNGSGTPSWTSGTVANRVLRTDGSAITFAQVALATDVSGTLPAGNGGTGQSSAFTANALVYASSTAALATGATLTWIPGTTTGTGSTAALYVNPSSLISGTAVNINVPTGGSSGKIIVGQLNGTDKFSVDANGNLRATTKSFDIEHPTKPGMRLVYGVLEGPEHGVYHRGTVEGKGKLVIELPEYWHKLVGENYTIQLTPWGNYAVHIVEKTENYFIIELSSNVIMKKFKSIKVDYIIHGSRLDAPLEIEQ